MEVHKIKRDDCRVLVWCEGAHVRLGPDDFPIGNRGGAFGGVLQK
jgi:hypothetical protein